MVARSMAVGLAYVQEPVLASEMWDVMRPGDPEQDALYAYYHDSPASRDPQDRMTDAKQSDSGPRTGHETGEMDTVEEGLFSIVETRVGGGSVGFEVLTGIR